jgi:hypothetical protein
MSCNEGIIFGIIRRVMASEIPEFASWRIVLTNDVPAIFMKWRTPVRFFAWNADSRKDAELIEAYFVKGKGMRGCISGELDDQKTTSVCLFPAADARPRSRRSIAHASPSSARRRDVPYPNG